MKRILLMMLFLILAISVFATEEDNPATKPTEHTLIIKAYKPKFDLAEEGGVRLIITDALTESEMSSLDTVNSNATALNLDSYAKAYLGNVNNPQRVIFSYRIESAVAPTSFDNPTYDFDLSFEVEPFYYYDGDVKDKGKLINAGYALTTETTNFVYDYSNKLSEVHIRKDDWMLTSCTHTLSLDIGIANNGTKRVSTENSSKKIDTHIQVKLAQTHTGYPLCDRNHFSPDFQDKDDWIARGAVSMAIDEIGYENAERGYYRSNVKVTLTYNG